AERLVLRCGLGEMFEQGRVIGAKAAALCGQPRIKGVRAIDFESLEKVAGELTGKSLQPFRVQRADATLHHMRNLDRIDLAVGEIESDKIALRIHALSTGIVDDWAELAQAPAQFAARIVRHVPQQIAQLT